MNTFPSLLAVSILVFASPAFSQTSHLYRPEQDKANGEVIRNEDDNAWDGEYASHNKPYNPLFIGETGSVTGEPVAVWARVRGYAIQIKGIQEDDSQAELAWSWEKPAEWKWVKLGSFTRSQLGKAIIIIRGPDATDNAGLDAVLVTSEPDLNPESLSQKELEARIESDLKANGSAK